VASALDVAHSAGICHRDVKPANIIVGDAGASALVDFGFARSAHLDASLHDEMVGTIRYLAPESAGLLPMPADERSDLYALGVVLFECLTGRAPFAGPTVRDLLRQHLSAPAPPLHTEGQPVHAPWRPSSTGCCARIRVSGTSRPRRWPRISRRSATCSPRAPPTRPS